MTEIPGHRLIAWAARLVPVRRRAEWQREWEAEAAYAWQRLLRDGSPSSLAVFRLRVRVLTCWIDALWERKQTMTMMGMWADLRFAARSLLRYPTFTTVAVVTLALGIGVNTAVFTLVDGVLISPLPFDEPEELLSLEHLGRDGRDELPMSTGLYALYQEQSRSIEELGLHSTQAVNLVGGGEPERVLVQAVTPTFFDVLGAEASVGRTFSEAEGAPDGPRVAILSDGMWRERFDADPGVIGQTVDINGVLREIIGVMPASFGYPDRRARLWLPMVVDPNQAPLAAFGMGGVARMAEGSTLETVDGELRGLIGRLDEFFPESGAVAFLAQVGLAPRVRPLKEALVGELDRTLWILLGTVGFVLLIACANVANLLIVRAESRQRELALRVAVGAGRGDVVRAFLSESLVLAVLGGLGGLLVAAGAVRVSMDLVPTNIPRLDEIGIDARVLTFTAAISIGSALLFGLFPLFRNGGDLAGQLRDGGGRGQTGSKHTHRLRNGLVVTQMALALVLLVGSGLMLRSFQAMRTMDPGFDAEGVLTARITIPTAEIQDNAEVVSFFATLLQRLGEHPRIESVGTAQSVPLGAGVGYHNLVVEDFPAGNGDIGVLASNNQISEGYLEAMGIDVVEGRTFQPGDGADGVRAAIVNAAFAERWWPGESALGRRMNRDSPNEAWFEIVGVVEDAHYNSLEDTPEHMVYWPATAGPPESPLPPRSVDVAIRTSGDPTGLIPVLRGAVAELNPRIPVSNPRAMTDVVADATARTAFTMVLLGAASGVALLLGIVGIYGVISYIVAQRTREIGVRMALGATASSVRSMVVRHGLVLAAWGVVVGLAGAAAMSRVIASILFGVTATDPWTYVVVAALLTVVAAGASWLPARRAAGVDPSNALRGD